MNGKVVLVTGATRGIGLACVKLFAKQGANVFMGAPFMDEAEEVMASLKQEGLYVTAVYHDAYKKETYKTMVDEVVEKAGRIDVLVNNFGMSNPQKDLDLENTKYEDFISMVDVNLASVFLACQAVIPYMKEQKDGAIINIASVGGIVPDVARIAYAVSKSSVITMTKALALQQARNNIRVNAVCPGQTATAAVKNNMSEEFQEIFLRHTPIRRMADPMEIAGAVAYFASDLAKYTTGQCMAVAGGFENHTPVYADLIEKSAGDRH